MFLRQTKKIGLIAGAILLVACGSTQKSPAEQIQQKQKVKKPIKTVAKGVEKNPTVIVYRCNKNKSVQVERQKKTKKSMKKETVTVTFQGTTHRLSSVVTKNGKKYTNIRWTWHETRNGTAFLYNNSNKTLAANCVKK